jgi:hypothetical protein
MHVFGIYRRYQLGSNSIRSQADPPSVTRVTSPSKGLPEQAGPLGRAQMATIERIQERDSITHLWRMQRLCHRQWLRLISYVEGKI